jgi:glycosyltransferase involved in cell wall biosynthesis
MGTDKPKSAGETIKFLFSGLFYMKGGKELVNAFIKISQKYPTAYLTIITPLHAVDKKDQERIKNVKNINLLDTSFSSKEMDQHYHDHDIFVLPTFRDSLGVVLLEALSFGMPLIATDQYATSEFFSEKPNGFIYPNHPMKDYDPKTGRMLGRFSDPSTFYKTLFKLQSNGKTKDVEKFLFESMEVFIRDPKLIKEYSKNSLTLYNEKFHYQLCADRMESLLFDEKK